MGKVGSTIALNTSVVTNRKNNNPYEKTGAVLVRSSSFNDCDADLLDRSLTSCQTRSVTAVPVVSQRLKMQLDPPVVTVKPSLRQRICQFYVDHPVYAWLIQQIGMQGIGIGMNFLVPGSGIACKCGCAAARVAYTAAGQFGGIGMANTALIGVAQLASQNTALKN